MTMQHSSIVNSDFGQIDEISTVAIFKLKLL